MHIRWEIDYIVSTHSRPKAAAYKIRLYGEPNRSFNTQPPEGGCVGLAFFIAASSHSFNTQPPEGGCFRLSSSKRTMWQVSTHSRPKAAANYVFK